MSEQVDCAVIGAGIDDLRLLSSDELAEMESNVRAEAMNIHCRKVINTSGLKAPAVAASITGPGEPAQDFLSSVPRNQAIPGLPNLDGIEAPGLTSSLAIADHVATLLH